MEKLLKDTIERVATVLEEDVLKVPVWVLSGGVPVTKKWRHAYRRVALVGFDEGPVVTDDMSRGTLLFAEAECDTEDGPVVVVAGPFDRASSWLTGDTVLTNTGDGLVTTTVPASVLTGTYLSVVFASVCQITREAPDKLHDAFNDIGLENVRRIGAALAQQIDPDGVSPTKMAHSFHRVPPLGHFVDKLSPQGSPEQLTETFGDITAGLPIGFHLTDLLARSLIRPGRYDILCQDVFRKHRGLACVLSDLRNLWQAVLCHGALPPEDGLYQYNCPALFTEIFAPLFVRDVAVGAVYAGQIVRTKKQRSAILEHASSLNVGPPSLYAEWNEKTTNCNRTTFGQVQCVCRGLASLSATTFAQWARAENESSIREALLEAASEHSLLDLGTRICAAIVEMLDVSECSIWTCRDEKLVLLATTARQLYVKNADDDVVTPTPSTGLVGHALYELGEGLTGLCGQNREALLTSCAEKTKGWVGKFSETSPGRQVQFVAVPLVRDAELCGVLRASKFVDAAPITKSDFTLLKDLAEEIAIAIREKSLAEQAKAHAESFEYIIKVGAHEFRGPLQNIVSLLTVLRNSLESVVASSGTSIRTHLGKIKAVHQQIPEPIPAGAEAGATGLRLAEDPVRVTGQWLARVRQVLNETLVLLNSLDAARRDTHQDLSVLMEEIEEEALRAKTQMNNALAFNAEISYDFRQERLGDLFLAAEKEFIARGRERNVSVAVWDSAKQLPAIRMDRERMAQVITNLLDNAVKYSFTGETVHVRGGVSKTKVHFSVENRGIGIPEEFRRRIFEPFQRKVVEDRKRFIVGTGLGLPIVKQLVGAHDGSISVTSVPFLDDPKRQTPEDGHIVTFTVQLPNDQMEAEK